MRSMGNPEVSIVIPVYGVEDRIGRFADSLFSQSLADSIEFIFVDDATKDRSMEIVGEVLDCRYSRLKERVKILRHETNRGLPAARNTGMKAATGRYIMHVDSDDFLDPYMIERLYERCRKDNLDVAWCDWNTVKGNNRIRVSEPDYSTGVEALLHTLVGPLHYNVWNKLTRRGLFTENGIEFPEGHSMGEDMTMMMVLACAGRVGKAEGYLYNYVKYDTGTITSAYADSHIRSLEYNVNRVCGFIENKFPDKYVREMAFMKLGMKSALLLSGCRPRLFRAWKRLFSDANEYIGLNNQTSGRVSFLEKCAKRNLFLPVAVYNLLIVDIYNRLRYR